MLELSGCAPEFFSSERLERPFLLRFTGSGEELSYLFTVAWMDTPERNAIVEANLWCNDSVIRQNRPLMRAARLEYDDVYQQLALRLIKAVAGYDPEKGRLEQHIFAQLKYELLSCKSAYRLCGMTGTPHSFRKSHIISIDTLSENSGLYEETLAA